MVMKNARDLFAQTDQQISALKERIARQREVIKRAKLGGHSTAAAETIQHTLHQSLRAFEKRRQQVFERLEAKREDANALRLPHRPVDRRREGGRRAEIGQSDQSRAGASQDATKAATRRITLGSANRGA
jgi:hypothetical protein